MRRFVSLSGLIGALLAMSPAPAGAAEAGWRGYEVSVSGSAPISAALFYPTDTPARDIKMGPFALHVAPMAPSAPNVKGLIVISHGTGGSELGHASLAEALARHGYLVAALRHPGDNWQDRSLWSRPPGDFFTERPIQVSRVIDALLADADWRSRIATDAKGPRIGVLGHSAGGFTAIALAGGQSDLLRIGTHCKAEVSEDPIFCGMVRADQPSPAAVSSTADRRVRAVVALAPLGVMFTAASLGSIAIPAAIYAAEKDRWLVPRFHAAWIAQNMPSAEFHTVAGAWHFAFMDRPDSPIMTLDGDAASDPPGFDRAAFLTQLRVKMAAFFDNAW